MISELKIKTTLLDSNKNFISGISQIYGLGVYSRLEILKRLGFNPTLNIQIKRLTNLHERFFFFL